MPKLSAVWPPVLLCAWLLNPATAAIHGLRAPPQLTELNEPHDSSALTATVAEQPREPSLTRGVGKYPGSNDLRVPDPRLRGGRIADTASMLDGGATERIGAEIRRIERDVEGSQVLVVTVADVPEGTSPKRVATELFNYFGIGSRDRENGVLVFVVRDARRVEIEVGLSLENLFSNSWCTSMLQADVIPAFKDGRYGDGVLSGVERIGERLRDGGRFEMFIFLFIVAAVGTLGLLVCVHEDRESRACPNCGVTISKEGVGSWETVEPATNLAPGRAERSYFCEACGERGKFSRILAKYDHVRYRNDGTPEYYNNQSNSGGSSSGGGGGGASW